MSPPLRDPDQLSDTELDQALTATWRGLTPPNLYPEIDLGKAIALRNLDLRTRSAISAVVGRGYSYTPVTLNPHLSPLGRRAFGASNSEEWASLSVDDMAHLAASSGKFDPIGDLVRDISSVSALPAALSGAAREAATKRWATTHDGRFPARKILSLWD